MRRVKKSICIVVHATYHVPAAARSYPTVSLSLNFPTEPWGHMVEAAGFAMFGQGITAFPRAGGAPVKYNDFAGWQIPIVTADNKSVVLLHIWVFGKQEHFASMYFLSQSKCTVTVLRRRYRARRAKKLWRSAKTRVRAQKLIDAAESCLETSTWLQNFSVICRGPLLWEEPTLALQITYSTNLVLPTCLFG